MAENNANKIVYSSVDGVNYSDYGFIPVGDGIIFSYNSLSIPNKLFKQLVDSHFREIADCYYLAMKYDSVGDKSRRRKLSTFLRSIWEQDDINVSLLMIKSLHHFKGDFNEIELVEKVVKEILPNANYYKVLEDRKYQWKWDERRKFDLGIGKFFVLSYINNSFNKDLTWKEVKKNCYMNDGKWYYKNGASKNRVSKILNMHVKNGGIIVEHMDCKFEAFIPFNVVNKDATGSEGFIRKATDGKDFYVSGVASTTSVDVDDERVSKDFIKKMKKMAVGLPLKVISHYGTGDINQTVGVITDKGGGDDVFAIEGKLQPPEDNENVGKLFKQMDFGIHYGFSISGRVTKTYREFDEKKKKEIWVLDDGTLNHVLITDQPANKDTFAQAIVKSIKDNKPDRSETEISANFKHSSSVSKNEPEEVDKESLPDQAFPINYSEGKVFKEYPHHFVDDDKLFLHKSSLLDSYRRALKDNAGTFVTNHLLDHLRISGLKNFAIELMDIVDKADNINEMKNNLESISVYVRDFVKGISMVNKLDSSKDSKIKVVNRLAEEVAPKITEILNEMNKG